MNNLVEIKSGQALTSSLLVADKFQKEHFNVIKAVKSVIKELEEGAFHLEGADPKFLESLYEDTQGHSRPMYLMNRDAFTLLVMGFTGKKALQFKLEFLGAFNKMEKALLRQQNEGWKEARLNGKQARRELTDTIQRFVQYATDQGSRNAKHYYSNITKMTYKHLALVQKGAKIGQNFRDMLDFANVAVLTLAELTAEKAIEQGMFEGLPYKQIYELAKNRVEVFAASNLHLLEGRTVSRISA